jgi:hypothetical protein
MKFEKKKPLASSVTNFATKENQKSKRNSKKETGLHYNKFRYQRKPKKKKKNSGEKKKTMACIVTYLATKGHQKNINK